MARKTIILFAVVAGVVAAGVVLAAVLVFHRMSLSHNANSGLANSQNSVTTTPAAGVANSSSAGTDAQPPAPGDATAPVPDTGQPAAEGAAPAAAPPDGGAAADSAAAPAIVVPAGTTLSVRLAEPLGSQTSQTGQTFSATLDHDIVVGGQTLIAAGASVTGQVAFARPVGALAGEANLQLKLTSVNVNGTDLRVVTAVRSFGPNVKGKSKVGRFMKGLAKRAMLEEREVVLDAQSAYSFTLRKAVQIQ